MDTYKFSITFFPFLLFTAFCLILSGCTSATHVAPYDVPSQTLENAIQEANNDPLFENDLIPQEWWLLFDDDQLTEFIQTSFARNPTLQQAKSQILAAAYTADYVHSSLFPFLGWGADVSRQKLSKTGVIPFETGPPGSGTPIIDVPVMPGSTGGIPVYFTLYETELNLTYNFDFWDKNRNAFRAALGRMRANIAEEAFAKLLLGIAVAQVYYDLQTKYKRQEILRALVENRLHYLNLVQKRIHGNLDNEIAFQNAESNLSDARDSLLQVQGDIAVSEYQLKAYLAGNFLEEIMQINITQKPLPRVPLPEDLPLHLISQRPDIIAQLWLIESAGRQIEVAKAGFYPDFNLAALFGFQTIHFGELFKWPSRYFNVDPAVTLPIFDGGKLLANLHESEINYDLAILEYNDLVINAAKEVLDGIAVLRNTWQRLQENANKLEHQTKSYQLTNLRVSHSLNNILDQLNSEEIMLMSQDQEVVALGRMIQAILGLIKALGGGYDTCEV